MKKAISIPDTISLYDPEIQELMEALPPVENWSYGNVGLRSSLPSWTSKLIERNVASLNKVSSKTFKHQPTPKTPENLQKWGSSPWDRDPSLLFGRGSVGSHSDSISGLCILTLLVASPMEAAGSSYIPEFLDYDVEFWQGAIHSLKPGESVLFDDRENHALISNGYWVFLSVPVFESRSQRK